MAVVYILYSKSLDKYYTGSCKCLEQRLEEHRQKIFRKAFTSKREDWELYFFVPELNYEQARMMEKHIKSMKSKKSFYEPKVAIGIQK